MCDSACKAVVFAELLTDLNAMEEGALRSQAIRLGTPVDILESVDKANDVKAAFIEHIVALETTRFTELDSMKNGALRKRAMHIGVHEDRLEEADDSDNWRAAIITLILSHTRTDPRRDQVSAPQPATPPAEIQQVEVGIQSDEEDGSNLRLCLRNTFLHVVDRNVEAQGLTRSRSSGCLSSHSSSRSQQQCPTPRVDPDLARLKKASSGFPVTHLNVHRLSLSRDQSSSASSSSVSNSDTATPTPWPGNRYSSNPQPSASSSSCSNSDIMIPMPGTIGNGHSSDDVSLDRDQPFQSEHVPLPLPDRVPIWSAGATQHPGKCRPCAWMWRTEGCSNGANCDFCHMCSERSLKRAVLARREAQRRKKGNRQ